MIKYNPQQACTCNLKVSDWHRLQISKPLDCIQHNTRAAHWLWITFTLSTRCKTKFRILQSRFVQICLFVPVEQRMPTAWPDVCLNAFVCISCARSRTGRMKSFNSAMVSHSPNWSHQIWHKLCMPCMISKILCSGWLDAALSAQREICRSLTKQSHRVRQEIICGCPKSFFDYLSMSSRHWTGRQLI